MTIGTTLYTLLHGKRVGKDPFGNAYYSERRAPKGRRTKRWVMYNGLPEPSKVPALWHSWLHYTSDVFPDARSLKRYVWEKPHLPNLTGTKGAFVPPGHARRGGERDASTSDYQAWMPK